MAVIARRLIRRFNFNGMSIPDPNPKLTTDQVVRALTGNLPELTNAKVEPGEQTTEDGCTIQTFNLKVSPTVRG
jgi:PRTRC genetic system protein C